MTGCYGCPCTGAPEPDWCPSAPATKCFSRGSPYGRICAPAARPSSAPIIPGEPNLPRGTPLGVVAYGIWGPVIQTPVRGRPTIVGGLPPTLLRGRITPSPRGRNSHPSLPMIPISPLLCARPHCDCAGSDKASTPSHPLSPPPELSVRFVEIRSFLLSSLLLRSKSQRFVPRTTNFPP